MSTTMCSPFEGRLTQHHEDFGGYKGHAGEDVAPPEPGQVGKPVYSAFDMTIRSIHRTAKHGNLKSTWAPYKTGNGLLGSNPDGQGNGYNHMRPLNHLSVGDHVKQGELIGYNDTSGNQSGPHLHFELWKNWEDVNSHYAPEYAFEKFGIKEGSKPKNTSIGNSVKPAGPVHSAPTPNATVRKRLQLMGFKQHGVQEVKEYQAWHGLKPDGIWGSRTEAKYDQVVAAQNATKVMKGVPDSWRSDGYWGTTSKHWAAFASNNNEWHNPHGWLTKSYINHLKAVRAWV